MSVGDSLPFDPMRLEGEPFVGDVVLTAELMNRALASVFGKLHLIRNGTGPTAMPAVCDQIGGRVYNGCDLLSPPSLADAAEAEKPLWN